MIRRTRTVALVLGLAAILGSLAGCGNVPQGAGARNDPVTESDESPERRRARIRLELAVGYFAEGRTEIALDEIKQALAVDPQYAAAHNLRGLVQMRLGDLRAAEDSFRRALALGPRDGDVLHNLAWLQCQQWLGIKVERKLSNLDAARQLAQQLSRRYPESTQWAAYQRGAFDE